MMVSKKRATVASTGKPATYQRGVGEPLPAWALLVTQNVVQPCGCAPERMPWGNSQTAAVASGSSVECSPLLHAHYQRLVTMAKRDASLTVSDSVEEADERHRTKTRHPEPVMGANPTGDAASPVGTPPG
jgi:hypothetical protein